MDKEQREHQNMPPVTDKAPLWQTRLVSSLGNFFSSQEPTREGFVDILWTKGILDHIAPTDPEEIKARNAKGRPVWDKGRDDSQLYWRILYSAAASKEAIEKAWTFATPSNNYVAGMFSGIHEAFRRGFIQKVYTDDQSTVADPSVSVINDVIERAKQELKARNQNTAGHPLQYGLTGEWNGL